MKIIHKNPEWIENRIKELEYQLQEIQQEYLIELEKASTIFNRRRNFEDDYRVQTIRNQIAYYISISVPTIIVMAENKEDEERLKELQERTTQNENNI